MDSVSDLSEKIKSKQNLLNVLTVKLYSIGSLFVSNIRIKRKVIFNPTMILINFFIVFVRQVLSLLLNDRNISLMLGDFAFKWKLKSMWNSILIIAILQTSSILVVHFQFHKTNDYPFRMSRHLKQTPYEVKWKQIFIIKLIEKTVTLTTIAYGLIHIISYTLSSTHFELLIYGLPWLVIDLPFIVYVTSVVFWNSIYFDVLTHNLKLQLRLENSRMKYLVTTTVSKLHLFNLTKSIMKNLNKIHFLIQWKSKFWSLFVFFNCFTSGSIGGICIAQLFGDANLVTRIFFIYAFLVEASIVTFLLYSAIRVHNEANYSLKVMNKIVFNHNIKYIPIGLRIKV